ncbi:hypothetical protein PENTCL1PPCAC_21675, partial [Pristionchus entomophagus]
PPLPLPLSPPAPPGSMLFQIGAWLGTLLLLAATVCAAVVGCNKKEKSEAKKRASLDMGVSYLDDVQPVKREANRAQEIKDGARPAPNKKNEYKTLMQLEKSDFDKSMGVWSEAPTSEAPKPAKT